MTVIRSICPSAHLNSFCRELCKRSGGFMFTYQTNDPGSIRRQIGWSTGTDFPSEADSDDARKRATECDLLLEMMRELDLMERRAAKGLTTVYVAERWFKPIKLPILGYKHLVSGFLRMLVPSYYKMAKRFVRLMDTENFWVFPTGIPGVRDMARIYGLLHGDWKCWFREPKLQFERKAGGKVWMADGTDGSKYGLRRMRVWGYFVEPSRGGKVERKGGDGQRTLSIFWCGGTIDWKRVDTLVAAWKLVKRRNPDVSLLIVGRGQMDAVLRKMVGKDAVEGFVGWQPGKVCFAPYQKQEKVRELMREADVYVMPSDGKEGWGAALSDALAEGCPVISTFEAGSSATILPDDWLFHAGDAQRLADLLMRPIKMVKYAPEDWGGEAAAARLLEIVEQLKGCRHEIDCQERE